ncbi:hypothetical protein BKA64DRAFT_711056 [Cadophora sp. MPI-SDFR-AT-0126]|nr:hypothetical protein BKA64DRAFT_711056 [Leotiomycetes sp. MPI-SDFR-AT-0126]
MESPPKHVEFLLEAANSDMPDNTPWSTFKFTLGRMKIDTSTIVETEAMNLFRNIRRAIIEERKDGMRDASREHIAAVLALANSDDVPDDVMSVWFSLKFCLTQSNKNLAIPDSADWLRSFTKFRRIIAGEEVEQDNPQHTPQHTPPAPSGVGEAQPDSAYGSMVSEGGPKNNGYVTVLLETCDRYERESLSIPCMISDQNEKHLMSRTASRRCSACPDQYGVAHVTCFSKDIPEPSVVQFEVVDDDLAVADIVFSRKVLNAEKNRNSIPDQLRGRDGSRSARSSADYFEEEEEEDKAASIVIGVALQDPRVRNLDDRGIANLGYKAELALRAARKARRCG